MICRPINCIRYVITLRYDRGVLKRGCVGLTGEKTVFKSIDIGFIWLKAQGMSTGVLVLVGDMGEL